MKRFIHILLMAVAVMVATGCDEWFQPIEQEKNMVLLYVAATEQSVSNYADGNIADLVSGYVPQKSSKTEELLIFVQKRDAASPTTRGEATLSRYYSNKSGQVTSELITNYGNEFNACDVASFERVLADAEAACKPTRRTLMFSSHGTGWMPRGYFDGKGDFSRAGGRQYAKAATEDYIQISKLSDPVESIGYDSKTKDELDIRDFAASVGKYHWDALLLDCCYMGAVEAAYQLRNCCDWILASPTEIIIYGFPYNSILEKAFKEPDQAGYTYIGQKYYELYQSQSGQFQSGTIALVKCSELDNLANVCADIIADRRAEMEAVDRMGVQHYFWKSSKDYFFDLAHWVEQFATAEQYAQFQARMDAAIPFKAATAEFIGLSINHYGGISCYIPNPDYPNLNSYYKQLAWNQKIKVVE